MRFRSHLPAKIPLDLTPMIDVVFQLLIFFILTLKIAQPEGDFEIAMPQFGPGTAAASAVPPLVVELLATDGGGLHEVVLNGRRLAGLDALHAAVEQLFGNDPALAQAASVELRCDQDLAYQHTMAAVTAVSGTRLPDGSIRPLIQQINFRRP